MVSSASLEASFTGDENTVRDLLLHRLAYFDIYDSCSLTALHLTTNNIHSHLMIVLLASVCNVNQFSADSLTSLIPTFLL